MGLARAARASQERAPGVGYCFLFLTCLHDCALRERRERVQAAALPALRQRQGAGRERPGRPPVGRVVLARARVAHNEHEHVTLSLH